MQRARKKIIDQVRRNSSTQREGTSKYMRRKTVNSTIHTRVKASSLSDQSCRLLMTTNELFGVLRSENAVSVASSDFVGVI